MTIPSSLVRKIKYFVLENQTLHNAVTTTGTGTTIDLDGQYASAKIRTNGVSGIEFQAEVQIGGAWFVVPMINLESGVIYYVAADGGEIGNSALQVDVSGAEQFRVNITSYTSGTVTIRATFSPHPATVTEQNTLETDHHTGATATGNGATAAIWRRYSMAVIYVSGSFTASLSAEADRTASFTSAASLLVQNAATGEFTAAITAAGTYYLFGLAGFTHFRVPIDSYTSGSITVVSNVSRLPMIPVPNKTLADILTADQAIQAAVEDSDTGYTPLGSHTTVSSLSTAQTITPAAGAREVIMQAFTQAVRYTADGTTPTASTGFQLAAGEIRAISVGGGATIKVIEESASASIQYQAVG